MEKFERTIRGIASSVYWGLCSRLGRNTIKRTLDSTTAVFPIEDELSTWMYWPHGGDLHGEKRVIRDALKMINSDDTFWDVGGGFGTYSAFLGQNCSNIVIFEPNHDRVSYIQKTLAYNGVEATTRQHALGNKDGFAILNADSSITYVDEISGEPNKFEVRRGDSIVSDSFRSPDVMKIDTEGSEIDVLQGMGDLLDDIRIIYIEPHPDKIKNFGSNWKEVEEYCEKYSFKLEKINVKKKYPLYRAVKSE